MEVLLATEKEKSYGKSSYEVSSSQVHFIKRSVDLVSSEAFFLSTAGHVLRPHPLVLRNQVLRSDSWKCA